MVLLFAGKDSKDVLMNGARGMAEGGRYCVSDVDTELLKRRSVHW